jgi:hypothetical protein
MTIEHHRYATISTSGSTSGQHRSKPADWGSCMFVWTGNICKRLFEGSGPSVPVDWWVMMAGLYNPPPSLASLSFMSCMAPLLMFCRCFSVFRSYSIGLSSCRMVEIHPFPSPFAGTASSMDGLRCSLSTLVILVDVLRERNKAGHRFKEL